MDNQVILVKNGTEYEDVDYPGVFWQILGYSNDRHDCLVCEFPIEIGQAFGNLDDSDQNAHIGCVIVKEG